MLQGTEIIKNMITGAGCADVALLLVPAEMGGFETAIARGDRGSGEVQGQTRQHARLLGLLGIEKLIVGVNKMDSCDWSEKRFNEIKEEMTKMIQTAGFKPKQVAFVPYSGFHGENLVEKTDKMPWYKGWKANISKDEVVEGHTHRMMLLRSWFVLQRGFLIRRFVSLLMAFTRSRVWVT